MMDLPGRISLGTAPPQVPAERKGRGGRCGNRFSGISLAALERILAGE
jgi:hypothetical protein